MDNMHAGGNLASPPPGEPPREEVPDESEYSLEERLDDFARRKWFIEKDELERSQYEEQRKQRIQKQQEEFDKFWKKDKCLQPRYSLTTSFLIDERRVIIDDSQSCGIFSKERMERRRKRKLRRRKLCNEKKN